MPELINHTPIDPDLVDRIFEYLLEEFPQIAGPGLAKAKRAVRDEFRGEEVYIAARGPSDRHELAVSVLSLFNGRNAREVARRLGIGRTTVWRIIKQAGDAKRPAFPGTGTAAPVRSSTLTAHEHTLERATWPSPPPTSQQSMLPLQAASSPSATTGGPSPTDP
ncbi:MAG TPA: hypothetical protein VFF19_06420 [Reyranella sp.]|nr:hypothetical protein [Reyranella sp.]